MQSARGVMSRVARRARFAVLAALAPFAAPAWSEPIANIDHIMLGVADLDEGIAAFEHLTAVRPVYGGKHPTGTHNALVALGGATYLELIAVQPGASAPPKFKALSGLEVPTPVGWAIALRDSARALARLADAGLHVTAPKAGSRVTAQGDTLHWQTFALQAAAAQAPFFIVWGRGSAHPSTTSATGCSLERWSVAGPDAELLGRLRSALEIPVTITAAPRAQMSLVLNCPKGRVEFHSARPL